MTVYLDAPDFTMYNGDVLDVLRELPAESVDCCVTSPPYWGLRDYGTGSWDGGRDACDHKGPPKASESSGLKNDGRPAERVGQNDYERAAAVPYREVCGKCGARRVDAQLGLEPTPAEYVARMVTVFEEVRRVLAPHGTCWLNLGDSYAGGGTLGRNDGGRPATLVPRGAGGAMIPSGYSAPQDAQPFARDSGLKQKDLVGIPWRVAFALQDAGWYLRSDIIWAKPNPMPESVTDRPTKAHEYVFLLTKQPRYFFDQEAVREPHTSTRWGGRYHTQPEDGKYTPDSDVRIAAASKARADRPAFDHYPDGGRNIRTVWEIATQPYAEAHFATYPEELVRRCVFAGCPEWVCGTCGKPRERIVAQAPNPYPGSSHDHTEDLTGPGAQRHTSGTPSGTIMAKRFHERGPNQTTGWTDCGHNNYRPGIVLDPFMGSGTTALVARHHGRRAVGIELNPEYCALAARRNAQQTIFGEVA